MSAKEYDIMKRKHYKQYFQKYEAVNDLETMMKMWNDMIGEFKTLKPGYNEILMWSKDHSFNNKKIQELFKSYGGKILTPEDFGVEVSPYARRLGISVGDLPTEYSMLDIGPKTVENYSRVIKAAKIIVLSGPMGVYEREEFMLGTKGVFDAVAESKAFSVLIELVFSS